MRRGSFYTIIYMLVVASVLSFLIASVSQALRERQQHMQQADMRRNILSAMGLHYCPVTAHDARKEMGIEERSDVQDCYDDFVRALVINYRGKVVENNRADADRISLEKELEKRPELREYPLFLRIDEGKITAYCIPLLGKGLWSTLYGFLALKPDLNTVAGITFYKQKETPGLGAEIQSLWFQQNFIGKKIRDEEGRLLSITVAKGKVDPNSLKAAHQVDGISGATHTCDGVTDLLKQCLLLYEPYFQKIRQGGDPYGG